MNVGGRDISRMSPSTSIWYALPLYLSIIVRGKNESYFIFGWVPYYRRSKFGVYIAVALAFKILGSVHIFAAAWAFRFLGPSIFPRRTHQIFL